MGERSQQSTAKASKQARVQRLLRQPSPDRSLNFATRRFLDDIDCIKEMYQAVVPVLQRKEKEREQKLRSFVHFLKHLPKSAKDLSPRKAERWLIQLQEFSKEVPKFGRSTLFFPQNAVVLLVSSYDTFYAGVLRSIFRAHPERFNTAEKALSYEEVLRLHSPKQALDRFMEKEIDQLLRDSHADQIAYLDKQLKLGLKERIDSWKDFIELTERRNLFVHTGGRVTTQYLQVCRANGIVPNPEFAEGKILRVDPEYIDNACKVLTEVALKISQAVYRNLWPKKLAVADGTLIDMGYDMLQTEQWDMASMIFDIGLSLPLKLTSSDDKRKTFVINKCIALSWTHQKPQMKQLLDAQDWSAADPKFRLAVAVLKEKYKQAETIMSSMSKNAPIREHEFRTWPLFRRFRQTVYFRRAFKKVYNREFRIKLQADKPSTII